MRVLHVVDVDLYMLLPYRVHVYYRRNGSGDLRLAIRWGAPGSKYTYSHESVSGLLKMYLGEIHSDVSIAKSGLFDSDGLVRIIKNAKPIHPSKVFRVYKTEHEAVQAMSELLSHSDIDADVDLTLESEWIDLRKD